jgi:DNA-directed RNA polymerase alpha subunit
MEHLILSCLESRLEEGGSLYGRFLLGPFRVGQGTTIATALRRTLLSELQGIAITEVEIDGAAHQYSSIVGVRESALDITLNLKQVVLTGKLLNELPAIGYINVVGPKEVCGNDLRLPKGICCVNKNQHIANVSSKSALTMKFVISSGKGYITYYHSAPDQALNPLLAKPKKRSLAQSLALPPSTRRITAITGSQSLSPVGREEIRGIKGYDSRFLRHLAGKVVLSSGAASDVVSYLKGRRVDTFLSNRQEDEMAKERAPLWLEQYQAQSSIVERRLPSNSLTESAVKSLPREPIIAPSEPDVLPNVLPSVIKNACNRQVAGTASYPTRDSLRDGKGFDNLTLEDQARSPSLQLFRGWSSGPQAKTSPKGERKKDVFFSALAQKSNSLGEGEKSNDHIQQESAFEAIAKDESNTFSSALSDRSFLPIDAVFMPVNSVNFSLQTDNQWQEPKERIILELWTNGSVSPRQALHEAATCLVHVFSLFRQPQVITPLKLSLSNDARSGSQTLPNRLDSALSKASTAWEGAEATRESEVVLTRQRNPVWRQDPLNPWGCEGGKTDLENLHLSVQAYMTLKQSKINTLHDLLSCPSTQLIKVVDGNKELFFEILAKMQELIC